MYYPGDFENKPYIDFESFFYGGTSFILMIPAFTEPDKKVSPSFLHVSEIFIF